MKPPAPFGSEDQETFVYWTLDPAPQKRIWRFVRYGSSATGRLIEPIHGDFGTNRVTRMVFTDHVEPVPPLVVLALAAEGKL